ncbi:MAG: hypothetical protein Q7U06_00155, partial [Pseudomonadota bacterium]|nr:hypothetical protein [Pseudomonadota bacterium]
MSDINMTATMTNGTNQVLQLQGYDGCSQPAVTLQPGAATTVTAGSNFQVKGYVTYQLQTGQGQAVSFNFYIPVVGSNSISLEASPSGYFTGTVANVSGWSPDIQVVFETVGAVELDAGYDNTFAFVNSMFQPQVRALTGIWNNVSTGTVGFADATSIQRIVAEWASLWQGGAPSQPCFASDAALLQAVAAYVESVGKTNVLWVPRISFVGWSGAANASPPIYQLNGYTSYALLNPDGTW